MSQYVDVDSLWHVALLALAFGAGCVAIYAIGIVGFSRAGDAAASPRQGVAGQALAALCLVVVALAIAFGVWTMLDK